MDKNHLDDYFQSRIGNYESNSSFDDDALWSNINKAITHKNPKSIFKKPIFYIGMASIATVISAAAAIVIHKYCINVSNKTIENSIHINTFKTNNIGADSISSIQPIIEPKSKTNIEIEKSNKINSFKLEKDNTTQSNPAIESNEIQKTVDTAITTPQQNQNLKIETEKNATKVVEEIKPQQVVRKITVLKKQIVQKDSVISVKRVRKH